MTRILVLGSSHVGALRQADARFRAAFPSVDIAYFAGTAPLFRAGRVSEAGFFEPRTRYQSDADIIARINDGKVTCDLNGYDKILCVGHRPSFGSTSGVLAEHDLLEGSRTGKSALVSRDFVHAVARDQLSGFVTELKWRFGQAHPFVFTLSPYPSEGIAERIGSYEHAQAFDNYMKHPDTPEIFTYWEALYDELMREAGYDVLRQPDVTVAGPASTKSRYAEGALHGDGSELGWADHRHMNADFGFEVLSAFAQEKLNIAPVTATP